MVDYASTKGAIVGFTRALAKNLAPKGIRVNAVAYVSNSIPLILFSLDAKANLHLAIALGLCIPPFNQLLGLLSKWKALGLVPRSDDPANQARLLLLSSGLRATKLLYTVSDTSL